MPRTSSLRVAVAQVESVLGDLDRNVGKHLDMIARARAEGVEVLLFPELSLTGHSAGASAIELAIPRDDPRILELARASGPMFTCLGFIEEAIAAQFHNTAIVVQDGRIAFLHRKINLATYGKLEDGKHFGSGRFVETFEVKPTWRASVLICNDLWNPALVHLAAVHGSTVMLVPISSAIEAVSAEFDNPGGWDIASRFYAMTYGLPILLANRVGTEGDLTFWGGSRIIDPTGCQLARAGAEEELLTGDLAYEALRRARYDLPTVRDSNLDLIHREVARLAEIVGVPDISRKA
jgi:predicted amidohydrolase